jgi:molybdate transport system substrate-binding protein
MLLNGDVDLAIQTGPELTAPGIEIVGGFPGDLGKDTVYGAGVGAASKTSDAGQALLKFLTSPEAQAVFKAKGYDPA